jgi:hypothetical protein
MMSVSEHGNEPLGSVKSEELLNQRNCYQHFKMRSVEWSYFENENMVPLDISFHLGVM